MFGAVGVWPRWSKRLNWRQPLWSKRLNWRIEEMKEGSDEGKRGEEKEGEGGETGGREKEKKEKREGSEVKRVAPGPSNYLARCLAALGTRRKSFRSTGATFILGEEYRGSIGE